MRKAYSQYQGEIAVRFGKSAYKRYFIILILWVAVLPVSALRASAQETKVSDLPKESIKALYLGQQALKEKRYDESSWNDTGKASIKPIAQKGINRYSRVADGNPYLQTSTTVKKS